MKNDTIQTPTPPPLVKCVCPGCVGHSGFTDETKNVFCPACSGSGVVERPEIETIACLGCKGTGDSPFEDGPNKGKGGPCPACAATGRVNHPAAPAFTLTPEEISIESRLTGIETRIARIEALFAP
jgi:hypothetical protein